VQKDKGDEFFEVLPEKVAIEINEGRRQLLLSIPSNVEGKFYHIHTINKKEVGWTKYLATANISISEASEEEEEIDIADELEKDQVKTEREQEKQKPILVKMLRDSPYYKLKEIGKDPLPVNDSRVLKKGNSYFLTVLRETEKWLCFETITLFGDSYEEWIPKSTFEVVKNE